MEAYLHFEKRQDFRDWLAQNGQTSGGVWLLFGKPGGPQTITAAQALEEALCFGWIDGQMQRLDDTAYIKYFSIRRENSKWSEKNKALAAQLESRGLMTAHGQAKIEAAKKNGQWDKPKAPPITEAEVALVAGLLEGHEPACAHFQAMAPSVKRTYTKAYLDAKTEAGRASRLAWMIERLDKNLKPM
ncbi:YdeI/OmpD-associated family protein [Ruminococcaceae bacterium OttesenSCG-928-A11]|nr:YdeI/OmpD-associated family protein [Ruminococcaceae bacterium OttesenSCG-928-A11]